MSSNGKYQCTCSNEGYAPDCPQAFMQNGTLMHTLKGENTLKPRNYGSPPSVVVEQTQPPAIKDVMDYMEKGHVKGGSSSSSYEAVDVSHDMIVPEGLSVQKQGQAFDDPFQHRSETIESYRWATDTDMQQSNRNEMQNFSPLKYGGVSMTEATIGGYRMDMDIAAEKFTKYVPLPPVYLPLIFIDKDLNFSHHFFQGMEILVGRKHIFRIVNREQYSDTDSKKLLPVIKSLILAGAKPSDTELTMFVKRVLSGTFNTLPTTQSSPDHDELVVAANMWGFQYLEPSMRCRDNDLRMWLHMAYMKYKVSWFNAFKSSGLPKFALDGVQDRYDSKGDESIKEARDQNSGQAPPALNQERRSRSHAHGSQKQRAVPERRSTGIMSRFMGN